MQTYETLKHAVWECKYHVVFIPKCRKKVLYGQIRRDLGVVFRELARQKECEIQEGHLMMDHVHMLISIPPKYSVAQVMGFMKGKSAIHIARVYAGRRRSFVGQQFWARGYWVSTVGRDETAVRRYIQEQEQEDRRLRPTGANAALSGSRYLKPPALPEVVDISPGFVIQLSR